MLDFFLDEYYRRNEDFYFWKPEEDRGVLEFKAPGIRKEDIEVTSRGNLLKIECKVGENPLSNFSKPLSVEYQDRNDVYDFDKTNVFYDAGILRLEIPKNGTKKAKKLMVKS